MKVNGIELLQMIKEGKVENNIEVKVLYMGLPTKHSLKYENNQIFWEPGEFYVSEFYDDNYSFEIIEKEKMIKELKIKQDSNTSNCYFLNEYGTKCFLTKHSKIIADKINELVREVNKLKGKNNDNK